MKTKCGEVCSSHGCTKSEGCPAGSPREQVEKLMGVWEKEAPAKVGRRYPAAPPYAPSHWNKTLKLWAKVVLIVTVSSMAAGFVVGSL
jgi:hypothetical protein